MTSRAAVMACALCMAIVSQSTIESSNQQSSIRNKSALRNPQSAISKWRVLFDGKSLDAWRGYKNDPVPKGWVIENGTLAKHERVADIVSKDEFGEFELGSPDWEAKVRASKFNDWPNYGRAKRGHIAMQGDHEGTLAFRNIRIRELK